MQKKCISILCAVFLILSLISPGTNAVASDLSPYEILVEHGYQGSVQEWLASLTGAGDISPYQMAAMMGYRGSEDDWLKILSGQWSQQNSLTSFTVTFQDYDGTVLKTETVASGGSATAPDAPVREGYIFTGWDAAFDQVISDLTITAQYRASSEPTLTVGSATVKPGDTQVELIVSVSDNPGIIGLVAKLTYDDSVLTITKAEKGEAFEELSYQKPSRYANDCNLIFYAPEVETVLDGEAFCLHLDVAADAQPGTYPIQLAIPQEAVSNGNARISVQTVIGNIIVE